MKRLIGNCTRAAIALAVLASLAGSMLRAEEVSPRPNDTPESLVQAALATELQGPSEGRKTLLDRALQLDPNYAPARWHSGYVRWNDSWTSVEDVPKLAAADPQLAAYRAKREGLVDAADNQRELARWCRKNKLTDEARIHWAKVLEFDPQDAEALSALGLQLHEGRLLTRAQIDEEKRQAGERLKALRHWQPKVVKWRKAIEHGSAGERAEALRQLSELNDPAAIPALELVLASDGDSKKTDELNFALIDAVDRLPSARTTEILLRRAVFHDSRKVRERACEQLKSRPPQAFVPQLISAAPPDPSVDVTTSASVLVLPGGSVFHAHLILLSDRYGERAIHYNSLHEYYSQRGVPAPNFIKQGALADASQIEREAHTMRVVSGRQAVMRAQLVERLHETLLRSTDILFDKDPETWEDAWTTYTESYVFTNPAYEPRRSDTIVVNRYQFTRMSCFPAGTPVMTDAGKVPIENLRPGDKVLAQDPNSGELTYKQVQSCTLRPAAPLVRIHVGGESISATRGHPFWVNGQGWRMAKHLKVGDLLHTLHGAVRVDALSEAAPAEAYNLVVTDFSTYFVGAAGFLVHDNLLVEEPTAQVPGLFTQTGVRE